MKTNELRIGNYLKYDDEIIQVSNLCKNYVKFYDKEDLLIGDNPEYFEPIELTEEVLVSLFGKPRTNGNKFDIYNIPIRGLEIQDRRKSALPTPTICIVKFGVHICNIKYLHQLQNVYYLLIGKELEVSL